MKQVDTHAHVFSATGPVVKDARYQPAYEASAEQYVDLLTQHHMDYGVLIQPSFLGYDNSQMLAAIAAYPTRLKGIAVVSPDIELDALTSLQHQGIVGVRLNLFGKALPDLTQYNWQCFLAHLNALNWQLELHCPPDYLVPLMHALRLHKAPIVIDHFGRVDPVKGVVDPQYLAFIDALDPERYWVKVSGHYRLGQGAQAEEHAIQALELLVKRGLAQRLVWGSDWPHTQHEQQISYDSTVNFLQKLIPDSLLRQQILSDNALALFGFQP